MTPGSRPRCPTGAVATPGRDVIRREYDLLHPRLTVVPVVGGARPAIDPAPGRTVVGHAELAVAMEAVADRRRAALRERIGELEAGLHAAADELADAQAVVDQRRADRDAFAEAARWVESLPALAAADRDRTAAAEAQMAERLRADRDAARALDRVLDQRASADAAIAEARRQLAALRQDGHDPARQRAAADLEAQAASVESRLTEAEDQARARSEQTKRDVGETERELERLARDQRDRLARLAALVDCLPGEARPPHDADPLRHVATVAGGLRGLAGVVDGELAGLQAEADRRRAGCDECRRRVDAARLALERIAPEDAAQALADLVTGVTDGVVVLDDVVAAAGAGGEDGLLRALEATEASAPLVLLSSDPTVLGWAIDLPADRGALAGPRTVEVLTATASLGEHR